jgi:hypothetical protein
MNPDTPLSPLVWAELLLLGLIWGGVFLATRIALDEIGVFQAGAMYWSAACRFRATRRSGARFWSWAFLTTPCPSA